MKTAVSNRVFNTLSIALGYAVGAQLGFLLALLPHWNVTLFWPPSGVALAAVVLAGRSVLPGIFLGAFVTTLTQLPSPFAPAMLSVALAIAAASTLSAQAAGALLRHIAPGAPNTASPAQLVFGCIGIGLACTLAATGGVASLYVAGLVPAGMVALSWGMWWLGDFCGMLIFTPIAWLAARFWKEHRTRFRPGPMTPVFVFNSSATAMSALVFMLLWNAETDGVSQSLARKAAVAAERVTQELLTVGSDLEAIRALRYASDRVSADEFRRYTAEVLGNRFIASGARGVEWVPRVSDPAAWETWMHNEVPSGVQLYELDSSGQRRPVARRDEYFPVQFIQPLTAANRRAIGFDLGSETLRRATLERARDTGQFSMAAPIDLMQLDASAPALLIAAPVYRPDITLDTVAARRANLTGFAAAVYLVGQVFEQALIDNADIDFHLFDEALPAGIQWYHTRVSPQRVRVEAEAAVAVPTLAKLQEGLHGTAGITFAEHNWRVVATPGPTYVQAQRTWTPWWVMALLLSLGVAIGSFLIERITAREKVENARRKTDKALLEAQSANEAKSYFMAAASHDIKQPLFALTILTDTLLMTRPPETTVPIIQGLKSSIQQMSAHFDSLMDFGKFHAGNFEVAPASFRLGELSARIDLEIAPLCAEKGLTWNLDMEDVPVWTDQELLLRVFRNLLTNAVQYTEAGKVCCTARAHDDFVEFLISDTGVGIAEEHHQAIFGKFVQMEKSGVGTAGIGLGLSIVAKINQALALGLQMSSVVGKGTEFRFRVLRASQEGSAA